MQSMAMVCIGSEEKALFNKNESKQAKEENITVKVRLIGQGLCKKLCFYLF